MRLLVCALCAWCVPALVEGACTGSSPSWASSVDRTSVASCITSATDGDTITIAAGTADWSGGGVTLNKDLTIIGQTMGCPTSCDGGTVLQVGTAAAFTATANNWRITGITFEGAGHSLGSIQINAGGASTATGWRVDHCHFKDTTARGISVGAFASTNGLGRDFPGLIDNNRFSATSRFKAVQVYGGSASAHGEWDTTLTLGGTSFVFVEDNQFVFSTLVDGAASTIDGDTGARFVLRYNTMVNADFTAHGIEECSDIDADDVCLWRSTHGWEVYKNTYSFSVSHIFGLMNFRGGSGVVWGNVGTGTASSSGTETIRYLYERGDLERTCLDTGACQGSSSYDGNQTSTFGYVCWQQVGATGSDGITPMPVYQWLNSWGGSVADHTEVEYEAKCNYQHVQLDRDILFAGAGVVASRPGTCSTGDAYWATDEGEWNASHSGPDGRLYRCVSANTWAVHYTPYTYPHPLRSIPAAPTNVRH